MSMTEGDKYKEGTGVSAEDAPDSEIREISSPQIDQTKEEIETLLEPSILCIDDDPVVGRSLQRLANKKGKTIYFNSATKALTAIYQLAPNSIILSDFDMPELTGADLAMRTFNFRKENHIAFIIISGGANIRKQKLVEKLIFNGIIDAYLSKPSNPDDLFQIIDAYYNKKTDR